VLTIAGFDPSSGAGVTADLKVFAAHGLYGMACVTALTVQSTLGVRRVEPVAVATIHDTLDALREDVAFAGIKIGMLGTAGAVEAVAEFLRQGGPGRERVVLDPVLRSSSGRELLESAGVAALMRDLIGAVGWITPNLDELAVLTALTVGGREDVPAAAVRLKEMAAAAGNPRLTVLVTGGHMEKPDDYLLSGDGTGHWLRGQRVETTSTHGTGCALSSALLSRLVLGGATGDNGLEAAIQAKRYVTGALKAAYPVGKGRGSMNHLFRIG
jgi:hydroxymethylpyrimidine/phosphomethylpyrimidine kinase